MAMALWCGAGVTVGGMVANVPGTGVVGSMVRLWIWCCHRKDWVAAKSILACLARLAWARCCLPKLRVLDVNVAGGAQPVVHSEVMAPLEVVHCSLSWAPLEVQQLGAERLPVEL
jgi:hypothetical protein